MATWQDGPEYAPVERPDAFQTPPGLTLTADPPAAPVPTDAVRTDAPVDRPVFDSPVDPVAPLASLTPVTAEVRDPQLPFDVAAATITSESAWGAMPTPAESAPSWPAPTVPPATMPPPYLPPTSLPPRMPPPPSGSWPPPPPPAGAWPPPPDPTAPFPLPGAGPAAGPFPAPGTPGWFGPGPYTPAPVPPRSSSPRQILAAATPGLMITLLIGGLISVIAPVLIVVCAILAGRVTVNTRAVKRAFRIVLGFLFLVAVLAGLSGSVYDFDDWWTIVGRWSLGMCWVLLVAVLILVARGLRSPGASPPPPRRANWG